MRLTRFTDYALRTLLFTAAHGERQVTIAEIQTAFQLSKGHLMKVVQLLAAEGYLKATRGRSGGIRLGMAPEKINLGALVRLTEPDFRLVECFGDNGTCFISAFCQLPGPLNAALDAFLATLDKHTLADMMFAKHGFQRTEKTTFPLRGPNLSAAQTKARHGTIGEP